MVQSPFFILQPSTNWRHTPEKKIKSTHNNDEKTQHSTRHDISGRRSPRTKPGAVFVSTNTRVFATCPAIKTSSIQKQSRCNHSKHISASGLPESLIRIHITGKAADAAYVQASNRLKNQQENEDPFTWPMVPWSCKKQTKMTSEADIKTTMLCPCLSSAPSSWALELEQALALELVVIQKQSRCNHSKHISASGFPELLIRIHITGKAADTAYFQASQHVKNQQENHG